MVDAWHQRLRVHHRAIDRFGLVERVSLVLRDGAVACVSTLELDWLHKIQHLAYLVRLLYELLRLIDR